MVRSIRTMDFAQSSQLTMALRNLNKVFDAFRHENVRSEELQLSLDTYLLNYNNTCYETTSRTPSELLFTYRPHTKLEVSAPTKEQLSPETEALQAQVQAKLEKRAEYANERSRPTKEFAFKIGDWVQKPLMALFDVFLPNAGNIHSS